MRGWKGREGGRDEREGEISEGGVGVGVGIKDSGSGVNTVRALR